MSLRSRSHDDDERRPIRKDDEYRRREDDGYRPRRDRPIYRADRDPYTRREPRRQRFYEYRSKLQIYVDNVPRDYDDRDLRELFLDMNPIDAHCMRSSNGEKIGFVQFEDENDQRRALNRQLDGGMRSFPRKIYNQHQADFDDSLYRQRRKRERSRSLSPHRPKEREFVGSPSLSPNA